MPVTFWEDQEFKELLREQASEARLPHWTLSSQISFMLRDYLGIWTEPYRPRIEKEKVRQAYTKRRRSLHCLTICLVLLGLPSTAGAEQRINPMTGRYETVQPDSVLRFNGPEREWIYAPPDARLELNRSTLRWEYPGQSRSVPPDPVPYEFRRDTEDLRLMAPDWPGAERDAW